MGKLSKKPSCSTSAKGENAGQKKISSFFKNSGLKENKPVSSSLFQQVGSNRGGSDANNATVKPVVKSPQNKELLISENDKTRKTDKDSLKPIKVHLEHDVIPETQFLSSPECEDSDTITPGKKEKIIDLSLTDHVTSDEESIIPGTPDVQLPRRPKPTHRSFLRPVSLLASRPNLRPPPVKNDAQKKKIKQLKKRLSTGGVSVTFNSDCDLEKKKSEGKNIQPSCKSSAAENFSAISPPNMVTNNVDSDCVEVENERTPSRKRLADSRISSSPKRTSTGCSKSEHSTPPVNLKTKDDRMSPNNQGDKTSANKGRQFPQTKKDIKAVNSYQCSMNRKTNLIENKNVTCADDDVLADILGELHTQLDSNVPSKNKNIFKNSSSRKSFTSLKKSHVKDKVLEDHKISSNIEVGENILDGFHENVFCDTRDLAKNSNLADSSPNVIDKQMTTAIAKDNNCLATHETPMTTENPPIYTRLSDETEVKIDAETNQKSSKDSFDNEFLNKNNENEIYDDMIPEDDSFMELAVNLQSESQELCDEFNSLSPFKINKREEKKQNSNYDVQPGIIMAEHFGRHQVTAVQFDKKKHELILSVKSLTESRSRTCHLQGFWSDSKVSVCDIVHILDVSFDETDTCQISDSSGLFVLHPDRLISGTSVVSGVHCLRRSVLNEIFKGVDSSNIYMLYGSIIHSFFQEALQKGVYEKDKLLKVARSVISQNKFLHDMYSQNVTEEAVMVEVIKYIPPFQAWIKKFTNIGQFALGARKPDSGITVTKIQDIEENIWSPRFGVKGKIDLTVEAKIWGKNPKPETKIVPLELKTGKATYSVEHKGQVTLYSMMSCDRRADPNMGLLVYLKEGDMQAVPVNSSNKAGLIQLRNDMAGYLVNRLQSSIGSDGKEISVIGQLPEPINSKRTCEKCPQLLNCATYSQEIEKVSFPPSHSMADLLSVTLSHLRPNHLDYFTRWCLMLELESAQGRGGKNLKEIWTMPAAEREKSGSCLSGMLLSSSELLETNQHILTFIRQRAHHSCHDSYLDKSGLSLNDTIVISAENKTLIALCMGTVIEITRDNIKISTDRDLEECKSGELILRLDKCDVFNTMGLYFTNLSRLMQDNPISANLRRLLLDKDKPLFLPTLSKGAIEKVRGIFKTLNKPQKTAILKVLMCKDYILVKGYPGTGKTSTIVSLVKILKLLGHSVLLASYTHSAVDNLLLKLKQDGVKFLRLGRLARIHQAIRPYAVENLVKNLKSVSDLREFYATQEIVATTCLGSNHVIFSQRKFDICIVDEASQVLQLACLGPLFTAERFVLVGDHKQLPPVVQSRDAKQLGMAESLFSHLDCPGVTYELNLQYRMNSTIMELSNELIYGGALKCGNQSVATSCLPATNQDRLQSSLKLPWLLTCLSGCLEVAAIFLDTSLVPAPESKDNQGLVKNDTEAEIVNIIITAFIQVGVDAEDIGVIAPYRNQVKLIKSTLTSGNHGDIEVNTVDQYQGRDKSVIIISFVKSSNKTATEVHAGELLNDIRRLNVAVTRAKHKLILLGNLKTLSLYSPVEKILSVLQKHQQIIALPTNAHKDIV